jgi:hypothetical protein
MRHNPDKAADAWLKDSEIPKLVTVPINFHSCFGTKHLRSDTCIVPLRLEDVELTTRLRFDKRN